MQIDRTDLLGWQILAAGPMDRPAGFFCDVVVHSESLSIDADCNGIADGADVCTFWNQLSSADSDP